MKFLHYLMNEVPAQIKLSILSGISGGLLGTVYQTLTDDANLKLASSLCTYGALVTMVLSWVYWLMRIRKKGDSNG